MVQEIKSIVLGNTFNLPSSLLDDSSEPLIRISKLNVIQSLSEYERDVERLKKSLEDYKESSSQYRSYTVTIKDYESYIENLSLFLDTFGDEDEKYVLNYND